MRSVLKSLLVLLIVAAIPLRGYAAVAAGMCDAHHGGTATPQSAVHDHTDGHSHEADAGNKSESSDFATVCSLCATCSVGASLAPDAVRALAFEPARASAIPFYGFIASGLAPDTLDRPPLSL